MFDFRDRALITLAHLLESVQKVHQSKMFSNDSPSAARELATLRDWIGKTLADYRNDPQDDEDVYTTKVLEATLEHLNTPTVKNHPRPRMADVHHRN